MKQRERLCWWCGKKLSHVSHAEIQEQMGRTVFVHKICAADAQAEIHRSKSVTIPTTRVRINGSNHDI